MHNEEKMTYKSIYMFIFKTGDDKPTACLTHRDSASKKGRGLAGGINFFLASTKLGKMLYG